MEKYVFSGDIRPYVHDKLMSVEGFEPLNILVTQLDRHGVDDAIKCKQDGFCQWFFVDSGAFSIHTGNARFPDRSIKEPTFRQWEDNYIEYLNSIDEYFDVCAQLDTIPGKFRQPKSPEDYAESARKSWENYLYMRSKLKSPEKLMPVFHYGEDLSALKNMLEWRAEDGSKLDYVGISPANDASQDEKDIYIAQCNDVIAKSSNPDVKTHLYGMTSLQSLSKNKCYSADSVSHRLQAAYNHLLSPTFGWISTSTRVRKENSKSGASFDYFANDHDMEILKSELAACNLTLAEVQEEADARTAFNIWAIQQLIKGKYKYDEEKKVKKPKRLF